MVPSLQVSPTKQKLRRDGNELQETRADPRLGDDVLEGGEVQPLQDYPIAEQHRANTARYLALSLVAILALSVLFQYVSTMILIYTGTGRCLRTPRTSP